MAVSSSKVDYSKQKNLNIKKTFMKLSSLGSDRQLEVAVRVEWSVVGSG